MHIIAADVGGTKTRLVFADADDPHNMLYEARYLSGEFDGFESLLKKFIEDTGQDTGKDSNQIGALTLALPGLVEADSARLTNLPWFIEKQSLKDTFSIKHVSFMNDFQASAIGTGLLLENDRIVLNAGRLNELSPRVAVGAGTGLGVAWAQSNKTDCCAYDTEGGHIDFAPLDDIQIRLLLFLQKRYGHVSYERLLSGAGLVNLYEFCAEKDCPEITAAWVNEQSQNNAIADSALSLFVQIYGSYIGNIALIFKPFGGIYITGGIAAKIITKMQSKDFINAYLNKGRMRTLVEQIPVYLVTNERIGVLGAMSEAIKMQQEIQ